MDYEYEGFDAFHLAIYGGRIKWLGQKGYFEGISSEVFPQISRVADGVYFYSWPVGPHGGDNVVHNYNSMTVNSHLQGGPPEAGLAMEMIHGRVNCLNTLDCKLPISELTPPEGFLDAITQNAIEHQLPPLFSPELNNQARFEEDALARTELAGQVIRYSTPEGVVGIEVDGEVTRVSIGDGAAESFQTYATKLAPSLYFLSWMGPNGGNHIIVNQQTGKVFDHIRPDGERA